MALPNPQPTIEDQISEYVSALSDKNKEAVLTVVRTISEAEREAEFERNWAEAVPIEEAFQQVQEHIRSLNWKTESH